MIAAHVTAIRSLGILHSNKPTSVSGIIANIGADSPTRAVARAPESQSVLMRNTKATTRYGHSKLNAG